MKIHKVEEQLQKAIRDLELELTAMEPGQRNQYNEDREALQAELTLMKRLSKEIDDWMLEGSRKVVEKMSEDWKNPEEK